MVNSENSLLVAENVDGSDRDGPNLAETTDRDDEEFLDPDAIAESYRHLVEQDRSAWTLELDVRPHVEEF